MSLCKKLSTEKLSRVFKCYVRIARNRQFFLLTLSLGLLGIPTFSFVAISSDIYINVLGYSELEYGYFFAFNASAFMIAPLVFSRTVRHLQLTYLLPISYFGILLSSVPFLFDQIPQPFQTGSADVVYHIFFRFRKTAR